MEPSKQQIHELRQQFLQKLEDEGTSDPDGFHPADMARVNNSDDWLRRFLLHHDLDNKDALKMLWEACEWRKKFGTNDISEATIDPLFFDEGGLFAHNRDKDGKFLLVFKCKKHVKGQHDMNELKKFVVYYFERLERQSRGDQISLFFDMADCGLPNMDMEFTKYLIGLFKSYYPHYLNYILVFEMAWILNAAFKIIKSWLPAKAVEKIKFVNKSSLKDYITPDQALVCWGGRDEYVYSFKPETNGRFEDGRKKVHFAETSSNHNSPSDFTHRSDLNYMLSIAPHETINFIMEGGELNGNLTVTNIFNKSVSFKIKTTSPEKFRVRPSTGLLAPQSSSTINVLLQTGYQASALSRDKFLVMALPIQNDAQDIVELWKGGSSNNQVEQHRLRCNFESTNSDTSSTLDNQGGRQGSPDVSKQLTDLKRQMSRFAESQQKLQKSVSCSEILLYLNLLVMVVLCIVLWYIVLPQPQDDPQHNMYSEKSCVD